MQLIAAGPAKQRRLTVAFRLILAIPHFLALIFLGIAGLVVAFIGWWGALFTGRLPGFAVSYLSGLARWNTRVYGYLYLLTDVYPPFTFDDDPGYPIVIAIPEQGQLNRVAVFFRFILVIWAYLVLGVVSGGANTIVLLIAWLITLITGKLPASLHLAYSAVLRYQARYFCYGFLLTSTYPGKLFGDAPATGAFAGPAGTTEFGQPATPTTSGWDTPADPSAAADYGTPSGAGAPAGYATFDSVYGTQAAGTPAYGTPAGYGGAQPPSAAQAWPLVLTRPARNLMVLFIVLGLIFDAGSNVFQIVRASHNSNSAAAQALAISQWNSADSTLNTKMEAWTTAENNCAQNLTCVTHGDAQAASYMSAFASSVKAISMPSGAASAATRTVADATKSAADFTTLSQSTSVAQYESAVTSTGLAKDVDAVQTDIGDVATAFNNS